MQKTAMFYLQNCDLWKLSKLEKNKNKTFQESIWKMTNNWHCSPQTEAWSAFFEQHSTSTVKSQCATEQLGPQGLILDTKYGKKVMIGRNKLWRAMTAEAARATIGSPLYPCQTYFPLSHGNGCHTILKSRKRRILWAKKNKIWKFGRFSASRSP